MPLTVSVFAGMTGHTTPQTLLFVSSSMLALNGLVDTILFFITRRSLIRSGSSADSRSRTRETHRLEAITVTRHEHTVVDLADAASTASIGLPSKATPLARPVEEKHVANERPFGNFAVYEENDSGDDESTKPRAL
jgi:hypothetical protein